MEYVVAGSLKCSWGADDDDEVCYLTLAVC